jgi:hypothetical protein
MALAQAIGNVDIEECEMIPEAAIKVSGGRFKIYLQANFKDRLGQRVRLRFSLAHEIAHTFFFQVQDGKLRPMKGGPRGDDLERACHEAAGQMLMPTCLLPAEIEKTRTVSGEDIIQFARIYDVSVETVLRRLRLHPAIEAQDTTFALCERGIIRFALYPTWLGSILRKPSGKSIQAWVRSSDVSLQDWFLSSGLAVEALTDGSFVARSESVALNARRVPCGTRDLFDIRRVFPGINLPTAHHG